MILHVRFPRPAPCPSQVLGAADPQDRPFVLRSGAGDGHLSRWSYAALESEARVTTIEEASEFMKGWSSPHGSLPPFAGGAVGYVGYDAAGPHPRLTTPLGLAMTEFGLYDAIYARDEVSLDGFILAQPTPRAMARAARLERVLRERFRRPRGGLVGELFAPVSRVTHMRRVREALGLIAEGEIYQVNLTCARCGRYRGEAGASYLRLLERAAPPFSAFLGLGAETALVSASPECFLDFDPCARRTTTYPIKGTRPRSLSPEEDEALAVELERSPKDRAEHLMIVDLLRNDLGRVAVIGSVAVERCAYRESFPTVHHLTSRISATLDQGHDPSRLFCAMFPGGSITGVPKLRAMEVIDALERSGRGVSTGSILYLGPNGAMRASIAIRTAEFAEGEVHFQVGGGIVSDSDPEEEWRETEVKARALELALLE